ncbi:CRISPR-associated endoribonuclease Cas6 [Marinitoga litoralis]|uniref:CRISPR-associated endoribonuclease Cas6 n=1 Tax=Marinitoga litoralis TaxID=570855 RepID=UPI00195F2B07|nr:CRISPR-associated endoribonuclease Cas6 [Marinitoga litoralis]MBM7558357.1 CRISPR-associated endoribonuclease Cas6 [Marinitoga litoralis]
MRLKLYLDYDELILPIHYNHILQAMILKYINNKEYANFIHDKGYEFNKRKYKMYTFSRIFGEYEIYNQFVKYKNRGQMIISSADNQLMVNLMDQMFKNPIIELINQKVKISKIDYSSIIPSEEFIVKTKSAITVYSTFEKENKKKTYYYSPFEEEFNELIKRNLINKYKAFYGIEPKNDNFNITHTKKPKEVILKYKNIIIKGWMGEFKLNGDPELLQFAYDSGIGSKNSIGFGCVEKI